MKTAFLIYIKAVGIYALLTLPVVALPIVYFISLFYVLIFGWFAWLLFTIIYMTTDMFRVNYISKKLVLIFGVIPSVAFAYQMIEILSAEKDVWHSEFIYFPIGAVFAGWISLFATRKRVNQDSPDYRVIEFSFEEKTSDQP